MQIYLCMMYIYIDICLCYNGIVRGWVCDKPAPKSVEAGDCMPTTKAGQKAVNKYMKNNYDRVNLVLPKGKKEIISAHAQNSG